MSAKKNVKNVQKEQKTPKPSRKAPSVPKITSGPNSITVTHRELLADLDAKTVLSLVATMVINPGLSQYFPWLASIANSFETYRFNKLCYRFSPTVGTDTNGGLLMLPEYNVNTPAPVVDKSSLSQYQNSIEGSPYKEICLNLSPASMDNGRQRHFVRNASVTVEGDMSLYDVATAYFYSFGADAGVSSFGELWVEYQVVLHTPQPAYVIASLSESSLKWGGFRNNVGFSGSTIWPHPLGPTVETLYEAFAGRFPENNGVSLLIADNESGGTRLQIDEPGMYTIDYYIDTTGSPEGVITDLTRIEHMYDPTYFTAKFVQPEKFNDLGCVVLSYTSSGTTVGPGSERTAQGLQSSHTYASVSLLIEVVGSDATFRLSGTEQHKNLLEFSYNVSSNNWGVGIGGAMVRCVRVGPATVSLKKSFPLPKRLERKKKVFPNSKPLGKSVELKEDEEFVQVPDPLVADTTTPQGDSQVVKSRSVIPDYKSLLKFYLSNRDK